MLNPEQDLQQRLDYQFKDEDLLKLALTHRSCGSNNNERLEFLGDSVLNHIIAEILYLRFSDAREGEMSRMRAALVKGETLAELARELHLGDYLHLGPGEKKSGGFRRDSILADTFEAIVGAMLLDTGIERCRERVYSWFGSRLEAIEPSTLSKDAKTQLQEYLQGRGKPLPQYHLVEVSGADHCQVFCVSCSVEAPQASFTAQGSTRRRAEQSAAAITLEALQQDGQD